MIGEDGLSTLSLSDSVLIAGLFRIRHKSSVVDRYRIFLCCRRALLDFRKLDVSSTYYGNNVESACTPEASMFKYVFLYDAVRRVTYGERL